VFLSARVDDVTVSSDSVFVERQNDGFRQPGYLTLSTDRLRITFTPDPWFDTATSYRVVATQALADDLGHPLSREYTSGFSTGPWPSPKAVHQAQFKVLVDRLGVGRSSHTSTVLPSGFVLIAGGYRSGLAVTASAELFDPDNDDFIPTMGSLSEAKGNHTATPMSNGLVLLAGGERAGDFRGLTSADLFSPATLKFLPTTPMNTERTFHTATPLIDGRVLVTGGRTKAADGTTIWHKSAEIYDPSDETWTPTDNEMEMVRAGHRATRLQDGRILITGGSGTNVAEIFDQTTGRFSTLDNRMFASRSLHGQVVLPNGVVFITDGGSKTGELFDPTANQFTQAGNQPGLVRSAALTFMFRPGEVLNLGGIDFEASFLHSTMEQYVQDYGVAGRYFNIPALPDHGVYLKDPRAYAAVSKLADGRFLITGGLGPSFDGADLDTAVVFDPRIEKPR
jgi:hypothetical protein